MVSQLVPSEQVYIILPKAREFVSVLMSCVTSSCLSVCYAILFYVHVLFVVITIRSFLLSWLITGIVTRVTGRVLHGEQELPTLPEHMSSFPGFSEVSVRSLFVPLFFFLWLWNYLSFFELMFLLYFWDLKILSTGIDCNLCTVSWRYPSFLCCCFFPDLILYNQ
jgi:hypothetical protein